MQTETPLITQEMKDYHPTEEEKFLTINKWTIRTIFHGNQTFKPDEQKLIKEAKEALMKEGIELELPVWSDGYIFKFI